jgi:hypothetical protein
MLSATVIYTHDSENFSFSTTIRSYADCAVFLAVQEICRFPNISIWSRAGSRLCSDLNLFFRMEQTAPRVQQSIYFWWHLMIGMCYLQQISVHKGLCKHSTYFN